ncbi:unnamed protein product [Arabidopsis halleri]
MREMYIYNLLLLFRIHSLFPFLFWGFKISFLFLGFKISFFFVGFLFS